MQSKASTMEQQPTPESIPRILKGTRPDQPPCAWTVVDAEGNQSHVIIEGMNAMEAIDATRELGLRLLISGTDATPPPNS